MKTTTAMAFPIAMRLVTAPTPLDPDTDGDGSDDGEEGDRGTDPLGSRHRW